MRAGLGWALALGAALGASGAVASPARTAAQQRAISASGLPAASVVSARSDMVVAIRGRGTPRTGGVIEGVTLQGEVTSAATAQMLGYRSMRSTVNIDCGRRRDMVVKMTVYSDHGAKGAAVVRQVPGGWAQPSPDAYLAAVIREMCGAAPEVASAPSRSATGADAADVSLERPQRLSNSAPPRIAAPALVVSDPLPPPSTPEMVGPDQPMRTSVEARRRAAQAQIALVAPAPELRPAVQPPPPVKPPPVALKPAPAKPTPAKAKPSVAPGRVSVQIAASPTEQQAREALAKVKRQLEPPLSTSVKTVVVEGKTFHRALIDGFQTRSEAQAFCATLKGSCFVR